MLLLLLLLVLLAQPARPALAAMKVIAATAATVVCRIALLLESIVERFGRVSGQHTLRPRAARISCPVTPEQVTRWLSTAPAGEAVRHERIDTVTESTTLRCKVRSTFRRRLASEHHAFPG
jgi:hypothetical protein